MRDQPAGDLERMTAASSVYDAVASWHRMFHIGGDLRRWQVYHASDWKIVLEWMKASDYYGI